MRLLWLTVFASFLSGCSFWGTLDDCADLAATVNPALEAVRRVAERGPRAPETYRSASNVYLLVSKILANKQYDATLLAPVEQYASLLEEVANNTQAFAVALDQDNRVSQQRAQGKARQHAVRQRQLVRRFDSICRGH
jgi:hypothetical protein